MNQNEFQTEVSNAMDLAKINILGPVHVKMANDGLRAIKNLENQIIATFDPLIKKAHESHRAIIAEKNRFLDPLIIAEAKLKLNISGYLAEQDRIRKDAEDRAREMERKKKEDDDRLLARATEIEKNGDANVAEEMIKQAIDAPAPIAIAIPQKIKLEGTMMRRVLKWKIVNEEIIPRPFLTVDRGRIDFEVRRDRENTKIPGISVYFENEIATKG